jgi:hypothetical protein
MPLPVTPPASGAVSVLLLPASLAFLLSGTGTGTEQGGGRRPSVRQVGDDENKWQYEAVLVVLCSGAIYRLQSFIKVLVIACQVDHKSSKKEDLGPVWFGGVKT